jgi:hypothetical protein
MFGIQGTSPRSRRASPTEEETMMQIAAQYDERDRLYQEITGGRLHQWMKQFDGQQDRDTLRGGGSVGPPSAHR